MAGTNYELTLVLAESALELVPRELWGHPSVYKYARRRGKPPGQILLDRSIHHQAMLRLPRSEKRGRPDIVHVSLLAALDSPLNREGMLKVYVHTINDYVIWINPKTRIPRNYNRFVGLMEQLFEVGQVPPNTPEPLITIQPMNLPSLISHIGSIEVILLSERGEQIKLAKLAARLAKAENPVVIVGGFPHGDFEKETYDLASEVYSIYGGRSLETWTVVSHVLAALAQELSIV
ncbi:MAG: 16S rRNA methyltransferase [Thermoproteota archaeon]